MYLRVSSFVALLLCAIGCASAPQPKPASDPIESEVAYRSERTTLRNGMVEIEVKIPSSPPGVKPVIISPFGDERSVLARGFGIVRYRTRWSKLAELDDRGRAPRPEPAVEPENRVGIWMLASPRPGIVGRAYFEFVRFDAALVSRVIDFLERVPDVDAARIGIAGSSTAGFVALEAMAIEPRLAAAAVRSTCGDYHAFLRDSQLALGGNEKWLEAGQIVLDADYDAALRAREPYARAELYPPRPLAMFNGERDRAVPFHCARRTAERLAAAYAAAGVSERFRFTTYPDAGHNLGSDTVRQTLDFFQRWLGDAPPRAAIGAAREDASDRRKPATPRHRSGS